jgi:hypothetical protein
MRVTRTVLEIRGSKSRGEANLLRSIGERRSIRVSPKVQILFLECFIPRINGLDSFPQNRIVDDRQDIEAISK